ncbi:MAG: glycosyltransferase family 9 protein [Rhodothermaceae bacterium]
MTQKRILISRPDRIGDVVLSTGIPREIKSQFPDSFVAVLVRSYTKDIFQNNPFVDEVIIDDFTPENKWEGFWKRAKEIRKFQFTDALMLLPNERICYMLFAAGIKNRVGVGHKLYQMLTFSKFVSRNKYIPLRHEADYCMDLARSIGVKTDNYSSEIYFSDEEKNKINEVKKELLGDKKYLVGIHTTYRNSTPNIETEEYKRIIELLNEREDIQVIVTDNDVPHEIKRIKNVKYPNVNNTLRESIINIAALDLFFSTATGPMHIASACGIKTVTLYCYLTPCRPERWGPFHPDAVVVFPDQKNCDKICEHHPEVCKYKGDESLSAENITSKILKAINYGN